MTPLFRRSRWLILLFAAPGLVFAASHAAPPCAPCGDWTLDAPASDDIDKAVESALQAYKPPKMRRPRFTPGDLASESQAEAEFSLMQPPGLRRQELRDELLRVSRSPATLRLRQEGDDVVIEAGPTDRRRLTPGEPHSRVDTRGTARIVSKLDRGSLSVSEEYDRKNENRESYRVDAGALVVTRTIERRGLPKLTLHSRYVAAAR